MGQGEIEVVVGERYTRELRGLRFEGFGYRALEEAEDEFDAASLHILARMDGAPVGTVRLTAHPLSPLSSWRIPVDDLASGEDVYEASRATVDTRARGLGLYRLIMTEALLVLNERGARACLAVIEPELPQRSWLAKVGFREVGQEMMGFRPPDRFVPLLRLVHEPQAALREVRLARAEIEASLEAKGYRTKSFSSGS